MESAKVKTYNEAFEVPFQLCKQNLNKIITVDKEHSIKLLDMFLLSEMATDTILSNSKYAYTIFLLSMSITMVVMILLVR